MDRISRLLLHWRAADLDVNAVSGQAGTFARASYGGALVDRNGGLRQPGRDQPGFDFADLDGDGAWEAPGLLVEGTRTQLVLYSEDLTNWSAVGTPTRVAAARRVGALALDLVGDDDAAGLEGYSRSLTFTGDAVKAVSVVMAKGTIDPGGAAGGTVRLRDTSAGVDRLVATVVFDAAGLPAVATATGVYLGAVKLGRGVYRFLFQTAAVTAVNSHTLSLYPATTTSLTAGEVGNVYLGGAQAEDAAFPSSYLPSTSSTVARGAESFTIPFDALPGDCTVYVRLARPVHASMAGALGADMGIFDLGDSATSHVWAYFAAGSRTIVAGLESGGAQTVSQAVPAGDPIEVAVQLTDVDTAPRIRLDVGAGYGSYSTAVPAALAAFANARMLVGGGPSSIRLFGAVRDVKVAAGLKTMDEMRGML